MRSVLAVSILSVAFLSCQAAYTLLPAPTITPTLTSTASPAATPEPTFTRTAIPLPTYKPRSSPLPTLAATLGPTLTPTPTVARPRAASISASPETAELSCRLDWKSPGDGWTVLRETRFSTGWKITNTGTATWRPDSVVFTYVSGAKLHNDAIVELNSAVPPGGSVILTVPMLAPRNSTFYESFWSLRRDATFFCRVAVSVYVR